MEKFENKLKAYISENAIHAEVLTFTETCHSAEDAAKALHAHIDQIVKSICFIGNNDQLIVAMVTGSDKVNMEKVGALLHIRKPRPATKDEVLEKTGYPVGGTPSFGYEAIFLIDPKVMEQEIIYIGGGSPNAVTKLPSEELQRVNKGTVVEIRK